MWEHVVTRLPVGRGELKKEAGWFTLVALAGGVPSRDVYDAVHALCVDSGWTDQNHQPIARYEINELVWPTLASVAGARWNSRDDWPSWVQAAAATVIFADGLG